MWGDDETPGDVRQLRQLYPSWVFGVHDVTVATGPGPSRQLWARRGDVTLRANNAGTLATLIERQPCPSCPPGS